MALVKDQMDILKQTFKEMLLKVNRDNFHTKYNDFSDLLEEYGNRVF